MSAPRPNISVVFWGHACFGVHQGGTHLLLIDPFDPEGLGAVSGPTPIPVSYAYVVASHAHSDHAAFHTQGQAQQLHAPCSTEHFAIETRTVAHDEFGGRLRGGTTDILDIRIQGLRILHCGDIGERPSPSLLNWMATPTPDLLIVPAGGYFTLGADGASELAAAVDPRHVVFCHTADDGLPLPQLDGRHVVRQRTRNWPSLAADRLHLSTTPTRQGATHIVAWLTRPDGKAFHSGEKRGETP